MRPSKHYARLLASISFAAALAFSCAAARAQDQSTGDPVADAARKAREQKKTAPKPKKVFTDDDVAPRPAERPAPPPAATAEASQASDVKLQSASGKDATQKDATQKEGPNSEQAWRKRFTDQRRKIADAEQELEVLQREAQKLNLQYYPDPQKAMQEQFTRDEINKKNDDIAAKKKELADLKQQLSDMEDQLRTSGGDPGWAR